MTPTQLGVFFACDRAVRPPPRRCFSIPLSSSSSSPSSPWDSSSSRIAGGGFGSWRRAAGSTWPRFRSTYSSWHSRSLWTSGSAFGSRGRPNLAGTSFSSSASSPTSAPLGRSSTSISSTRARPRSPIFSGWNYSPPISTLPLPIGLSFHTFQSLAYIIDVRNRKQVA